MYIPLRVFSLFSVGFGAVRVEELVGFCKEHGIPAAGFADRDTLGGVMTLSKALAGAGIQPICGVTIRASHDGVEGDLVLFAATAEGYAGILSITNRWNTSPQPVAPTIAEIAQIAGAGTRGMIVLTGGRSGLLNQLIEQGKDASGLIARLSRVFEDGLYLEIQRDTSEPGVLEAEILALGDQAGLPLVATSEAHYAGEDMTGAHDAFLCISNKTYLAEAARVHAQPGRHLVAPEEMARRFADLPEAVANTVEIARRIGFMAEGARPRLPAFPTENGETEEDCLRRLAAEGLERRLARRSAMDLSGDYQARLAYELDVIVKMGFAGYFLIVADFIGWARANGIPVGPGRGSGAGSLVAYATGITDIDPLEFGLLFERFLNPERVSMPDFDVDFCQKRREEVIDYVRGKYGDERVAHIAAFGSLNARGVLRDVGRVMQIAYPVVDRYAKMIPQNPANPISLAEAMQEPDLAADIERADGDIRAMFEISLQLEGLYRHVSIHAAGMIISDMPVSEVVPVHRDASGKLCTSLEMKAVEAAGLVKFDFLGLKNLDIIQETIDFVQEIRGEGVDFEDIGFEDSSTFAQLASGDGFAVFQLESQGMRKAMTELQVSNIEELIALISLYRPGPMDQISTYAAVKRGDSQVHYAHDEAREILEPTNGVMIYQEQVMAMAQRLAGYSLGDADLLRRAMGKKIQSEMDAQRKRFTDGASAGWVEVTTSSGETRRMHALTRLAALDGSGRTVTLQQALEEDMEVAL